MTVEKKFFIAGVQHHQYKEVLDELGEVEFLDLVPDPENKFDPNAVKIMYGEVMLGFVPQKFSADVSAMLELGPVDCEITLFNPTAKPWEMIEVTIKMVDMEEMMPEDYVDESPLESDEEE